MEPDTGLEIIAHRGLHRSGGPVENSREAVRSALNSGVDGLEVDLQLLGDGTLVLFHDDSLSGWTDGADVRPLGSLTYADFRDAVDFDPLSLRELLELDWQDKRIILECKPNRNRLSLVRQLLLKLPSNTELPITLSSHDWGILKQLAHRTTCALAPVLTSLRGRSDAGLKRFRWSELHLSLELTADPETPDLARDNDVIVWTLNEPERLEELETLGIKGIMTDNPDAFETLVN